MTKQPNALRLADSLKERHAAWYGKDGAPSCLTEASAELSRLHAETTNQQDWLVEWRKCEDELKRLNEVNQELLDAFHKMRNAAAGYSNYCEDSASVIRCERDFESATGLRRGFILHKIMQNNLRECKHGLC